MSASQKLFPIKPLKEWTSGEIHSASLEEVDAAILECKVIDLNPGIKGVARAVRELGHAVFDPDHRSSTRLESPLAEIADDNLFNQIVKNASTGALTDTMLMHTHNAFNSPNYPFIARVMNRKYCPLLFTRKYFEWNQFIASDRLVISCQDQCNNRPAEWERHCQFVNSPAESMRTYPCELMRFFEKYAVSGSLTEGKAWLFILSKARAVAPVGDTSDRLDKKINDIQKQLIIKTLESEIARLQEKYGKTAEKPIATQRMLYLQGFIEGDDFSSSSVSALSRNMHTTEWLASTGQKNINALVKTLEENNKIAHPVRSQKKNIFSIFKCQAANNIHAKDQGHAIAFQRLKND